jgi:hypothetical protein
MALEALETDTGAPFLGDLGTLTLPGCRARAGRGSASSTRSEGAPWADTVFASRYLGDGRVFIEAKGRAVLRG